MREPRRATINDLRQAISCLPRITRIAMLEGIDRNEIIVGAYSDAGGICPMLAAHRAGGRTNFASFARAWDRFAFRDAGSRFAFRQAGRHAARRATARELLVLKSHLEASLLEDDGPAPDLAAATAEHRRLTAARNEHVDERKGNRDRSRELRSRPGWAWTRIARTHDEYAQVLEALARERGSVGEREVAAC